MDLPKIKTLIDFVGRTNVTELTVTESDGPDFPNRWAVGDYCRDEFDRR